MYVALVAPGMFTEFFRHWNVGTGDPAMPTEKEAGLPMHGVTFAGCEVNEGETFTAKVAALLVTLVHELVTTQS